VRSKCAVCSSASLAYRVLRRVPLPWTLARRSSLSKPASIRLGNEDRRPSKTVRPRSTSPLAERNSSWANLEVVFYAALKKKISSQSPKFFYNYASFLFDTMTSPDQVRFKINCTYLVLAGLDVNADHPLVDLLGLVVLAAALKKKISSQSPKFFYNYASFLFDTMTSPDRARVVSVESKIQDKLHIPGSCRIGCKC
jgi:hypothetical protein